MFVSLVSILQYALLVSMEILLQERLLEHRHIRCVRLLIETTRNDDKLLGDYWEYIFNALSEVAKLVQFFELIARVNRVETTTRRQITEDIKSNMNNYDTANGKLKESKVIILLKIVLIHQKILDSE